MVTENEPLVDNWYQDLENGSKFMVVALDQDRDMVEIQYFDGDIEDVDLSTWYEMDLDIIEAPEDWTGPLDEVGDDLLDDFDEDDDENDENDENDDWDEPHGERAGWGDDDEEEEKPRRSRRDEWDQG